MNHAVPRLRMFAGPNGSGKSTIKSMVPAKLLGVYLNPDEITDGHDLDLRCDPMPLWFQKAIWEKVEPHA